MYRNALKLFKKFRSQHSLHNSWPVPLTHIEYFVAFLYEQRYSPKSASTYLSAISYAHKVNNLPNQTTQYRCQKLLEGYRRSNPSTDHRLPILYGTLVKIWHELSNVCFSDFEAHMFRAAYTLAFFGLFRVSEIVWTSAIEPDRQLQMSDIYFGQSPAKVMRIQLKKSKTNQAGMAEMVKIHPIKSVVCPVKAMSQYLNVRPSISGHLFCHVDGSPLTRYQFSAVLTKTLHALHMDTTHYKTHSFRIGAATWLAKQGTSHDTIKKLGRWSSNSFLRYIRL